MLDVGVRVAFRVGFEAKTGTRVRVRTTAGFSLGGAVAGFRHGAGAGIGLGSRVALGVGLVEEAEQHAGEQLGLCRQQGNTVQSGEAGEMLASCLFPCCSPRHLKMSACALQKSTAVAKDLSRNFEQKHSSPYMSMYR